MWHKGMRGVPYGPPDGAHWGLWGTLVPMKRGVPKMDIKKPNFFLLFYIVITISNLKFDIFVDLWHFSRKYALLKISLKNLNFNLLARQRALLHLEDTLSPFWDKIKYI